ncbi:hypothetical protein [Methylobacterium planeticum]|uniref:Uncharacterized protein n=1 Tax=Methylobacterium planeticum TaxID=2615211 RepID=A0A6N6MDH2_9HYPH|nr:hypothetical protein [Methylobacterium planeticum]KAB1068749.1 hypothetical protein F6X51_26430 [Methylobacterium planeticum]
MQRHSTTSGIVWFTPDEVAEMIREKLRAEGVAQEMVCVQVVIPAHDTERKEVFDAVPRINVILSDAGQ